MSNTLFIKDIAKVTNGKSDVKDAIEDGKYLFFDRSSIVKKSNIYLFDTEAIIIPGEDSRQIFEPKYFNGKFNLHQRCYVIYGFNDSFLPKYLFYKLKTLTKHFRNVNVGSTVPSLRLDHITDLKIDFPTSEEQQKIAKVLSSLDAKIELNNKINKELEAMAKTLYDYWFVQFDFPDEDGKPYKSSGGKMVYNQELKKEIPEGWEVKELEKISNIMAGGDKPKQFSPVETTNFSIPIYSNGIENEGLYGFTNKARVLLPSITISARGTIGYTCIRFKPYLPIVRLISITPKSDNQIVYFYQSIKTLVFENSGSVQQQLTVPQVSKLKVIIPPEKYLNKYEEVGSLLFNKIENNKQQNQELAKLRDWLLPMLMNGQVKVA
ncbi:restriction endonuclease subunit S [Francisella sp. LA112445]|uniref:restriction endonuclease subunit S n=1 Tax=Francisella sp. LA112445 TaxID=1395624 RepID=UPI001788D2AB|nr:restriction endonuclease subunit S [Francisella sp. LA112445]QIW10156.1 restriction endonuclease subunit S [Francisella sp. LA112445]